MTRPVLGRAVRRGAGTRQVGVPVGGRLGVRVGVLAGASLLLLAAALVAASGQVSGPERAAFRPVNDAALPFALLWPVMQLGNVLAVPAAAAVALALRQGRRALELLTAGAAAYLLARALKLVVDRPRPGVLLPDVALRGADDSGMGFPSGHAAVAVALAGVLWPHLSARARWAVGLTAAVVCLARVHVGAHLPLDVVGGAALGVVCAAAVLLPRARSWSQDRD